MIISILTEAGANLQRGGVGRSFSRFISWAAVILLPGISFEAIPCLAQDVKQVVDMQGKDCLDSDCHSDLIAKKMIHEPVVEGKCVSCHEHPLEEVHFFRPAFPPEELCKACHITILRNYVHQPVMEGKCIDCHNPHQSDFQFMLKSDPAQDLCLDCHLEDAYMSSEHLHGPVATGQCILCHESHSSWNPKLTIKEGKQLCLYCHEQVTRRIDESRHIHTPVQQECESCHAPHGSNYAYNLLDRPSVFCLKCHDDIAATIKSSSRVHSAISTRDECVNCHSGHATVLPKLLKQTLLDSCISCHNEELLRADGSKIANIALLLKNNPDHHGPVNRADCNSCHNPHASPNFDLLNHKYPEFFYAPFNLGTYDLCFQCHIEDMVTVPKGKGVTRFEQGEQNLHFLHVNKEQRGRTCRACHEVHASSYPFHIRKSVPYGPGGWEYVIDYQQTDRGGICSSGCHKTQQYERDDNDLPVLIPRLTLPLPGQKVIKIDKNNQNQIEDRKP